ncbi:MAG: signal recognition particle-docking protein FtsY [Chloroflexota bacterium]|nr:MAG: signal recognition particle-docking protein FtsY [Chloroflexota bacterium]UCF27720.1 MAG: signal recognition particle-docking protein FtsY [Chloroflexota bacterium]
MSDRFTKWKNGLAKTSKATFGQIATLLGTSEISDETYEDLEALLIKSDLGIETSESLLEVLWERERQEGLTKTTELTDVLRAELRQRLDIPPNLELISKPTIILIVGVNGSGKTTTIAKLGKRYQEQGRQVIFGAADTYRAAAVDQLQVWGERLNIPVIAGMQDGDPGAVAYDTVQSAVARKFDLAFIDTAGRLHTRFNLMEELKKVHRVVGKALSGAPHEVWLVMDATTGQNALQQAHAFKDAVNVTGIILAKLDSSARGGMAFAIQKELGLPIIFAGLGESPDDLQPFDPDLFVDGILAQEK